MEKNCAHLGMKQINIALLNIFIKSQVVLFFRLDMNRFYKASNLNDKLDNT